MKGAIIGFGFIAARGHLPAYRKSPGFEIVAVADICAARRAAAARLLPDARVYPGHAELLAGEPDLDFIDIATPPCDHVPIALAAIDRGLHVVCEKPVGMTAAEVGALADAARRAGVVVQPCHNYLHAPVVVTLRRLIGEGALGDVRTMTINTYRTRHARGTPEWKPDWRRIAATAGGGIGMDHGSHSLYLMFACMGGYPRTVSARAFHGDAAWDTEDTLACTLGYDQGLVSVYLTWDAGVRKVLYAVHGQKGAAIIDDDNLFLSCGQAAPTSVASNFDDATHAEWFEPLFEDFRRAVARGERGNRELEDAWMCSYVIDLAYRSAADGGRELAVAPARAGGA